MDEVFFAGVDIGTQGTKAAIYSQEGRLAAEAFCPSELRRPGPGMVEEDPERQFASVCTTLKACIESAKIDPGAIACVAIDGQMAGTIGVGDDARALTPYDSWLDTRCSPWIERMKKGAGAEILAKTGNAPSFNQGPKILYWKHEHPSVYANIRAFVQPGSYAAMRLCGLGIDNAYVDDTYLHFSGFADNAAGKWDPELCREFGVDPAKLPRIAAPSEIVGTVSAGAAALSGLAAGTPVAAGLGDTAASFLSCGATEPGVCVDVAGTASVFATTSSSFVPDLCAGVMGIGRSAVPGLWHPYAYINGGGMNILWFAGMIASGVDISRGDPALQAGAGASGAGAPGAGASGGRPVDFDDLDALVRRLEPRMDDPWFIPHLEGRVMPSDPGMRGAWAGLHWSHGLDRLYRAVLEGAAFEYSVYLSAIRRLYPRLALREVRITGGGAKSGAWTSTKADILGLSFRAVRGSGGAPEGAAMLAAYAVSTAGRAGGTGSGPEARSGKLAELARGWLGFDETVEPRVDRKDLYSRRFAQYERLLEALAGFPDDKED